MDDIYSRVPVNKTAAIVTGQSGCASDGTLSGEQLRENLVAQWKHVREQIEVLSRGSLRRKELGRRLHDLQVKINAIRLKRKALEVKDYLIECIKETLTKPQFDILMAKAVAAMNKDRAE